MGKCETCAHVSVCGYAGDDGDQRATGFCADYLPKINRKELVGLAEYLESYADGAASAEGHPYINAGELWSFADTIREAIGDDGS